MTEEKKEEQIKPDIPKGKMATRQLVVVTDGNSFNIGSETTCSTLEIKEICREILMKLGG